MLSTRPCSTRPGKASIFDVHGLAVLHGGELGFLVVRRDPHVVGYEGKKGLADCHVVAGFNRFAGDASADRRVDFGVRELEIRVADGDFPGLDGGAGDGEFGVSGILTGLLGLDVGLGGGEVGPGGVERRGGSIVGGFGGVEAGLGDGLDVAG